jgi:multidrug efflux pump subunit AcrA (membrane-fusion protein)
MNTQVNSMGKPSFMQTPWFRVAVVAVIIAGCLGAVAFAPVRETVQSLFAGRSKEGSDEKQKAEGAVLIEMGKNQGLRLPPETVASMEITTKEAKEAKPEDVRALPPQIGTLNYTNNGLFPIPSRFPGEAIKFGEVVDTENPTPTRMRPLRAYDKVKQGDLLVVIWSQQLGTNKAALVDAISALRLSERAFDRQKGLMKTISTTIAAYEAAQAQFEKDKNALRTAERTLRIVSRLTDKEIEEIKEEAKTLLDQNKTPTLEQEKNWARVEVRVPWFDEANPNRELVIVEKNINVNQMVDPINTPYLFKLADLSKLQIWVYPPEEYLPIIDKGVQKGAGRLQWDIRFLADPPEVPPQRLDIANVAPTIVADQHTALVFGFLDNPEGKYRVGQNVTATIHVPPDKDTVEIPTVALNQVEGQAFVFVQDDPAKPEYSLRRVRVTSTFKDVTYVRSKLTDEDKRNSETEVKRGRLPLQPLPPGARVITRGVVELTRALDDLATKERVARTKAGR